MAHISFTGDDARIVVRHNAVVDRVCIRIGYDASILLRDPEEVHDLVDQLQAAAKAQAAHRGRELVRDENAVRFHADIREALQ
ncbi:hypothetical protein [Rhodococcus sp. B10]|uniref:hypothetical protein n=1 Tax=Rhodococcus sp. B10 TaxID=2695876 RepID=UPI001430EA4A|nr:hypothetical protein [Rhodococcus sp. B10]NIL74423.1 hypothetical protein [Rhodococcus sp. B10]